MDNPASHQGTERPDAKNSEVFLPARCPKKSAGTKQTRIEMATMIQSMGWRCMCGCADCFYACQRSAFHALNAGAKARKMRRCVTRLLLAFVRNFCIN